MPAADEAWNDTALAALLQRYDVFVNLHKDRRTRSGRAAALESFRNSLLLSARKLVISERAHARDESEYDGMVVFSDDIASDYYRLVDDMHAGSVARMLIRSSAKFRERFAPVELFRRAGIYHAWGLKEDAGR